MQEGRTCGKEACRASNPDIRASRLRLRLRHHWVPQTTRTGPPRQSWGAAERKRGLGQAPPWTPQDRPSQTKGRVFTERGNPAGLRQMTQRPALSELGRLRAQARGALGLGTQRRRGTEAAPRGKGLGAGSNGQASAHAFCAGHTTAGLGLPCGSWTARDLSRGPRSTPPMDTTPGPLQCFQEPQAEAGDD